MSDTDSYIDIGAIESDGSEYCAEASPVVLKTRTSKRKISKNSCSTSDSTISSPTIPKKSSISTPVGSKRARGSPWTVLGIKKSRTVTGFQVFKQEYLTTEVKHGKASEYSEYVIYLMARL